MINVKQLHTAIVNAKASMLLKSQHPMPILEFCRFEFSFDKLTITSTDPDSRLVQGIPALSSPH